MANQMVVFLLGQEHYGLPISAVREIIVPPVIRSVPQAKEHVRGLINLRGKVISVLDLTGLLGLPSIPMAEKQRRIVVLERKDTLLGIEVDAVYEVTNLDDSKVELPPEYAGDSGYLAGIANQGENLLLILDVEKIFMH